MQKLLISLLFSCSLFCMEEYNENQYSMQINQSIKDINTLSDNLPYFFMSIAGKEENQQLESVMDFATKLTNGINNARSSFDHALQNNEIPCHDPLGTVDDIINICRSMRFHIKNIKEAQQLYSSNISNNVMDFLMGYINAGQATCNLWLMTLNNYASYYPRTGMLTKQPINLRDEYICLRNSEELTYANEIMTARYNKNLVEALNQIYAHFAISCNNYQSKSPVCFQNEILISNELNKEEQRQTNNTMFCPIRKNGTQYRNEFTELSKQLKSKKFLIALDSIKINKIKIQIRTLYEYAKKQFELKNHIIEKVEQEILPILYKQRNKKELSEKQIEVNNIIGIFYYYSLHLINGNECISNDKKLMKFDEYRQKQELTECSFLDGYEQRSLKSLYNSILKKKKLEDTPLLYLLYQECLIQSDT